MHFQTPKSATSAPPVRAEVCGPSLVYAQDMASTKKPSSKKKKTPAKAAKGKAPSAPSTPGPLVPGRIVLVDFEGEVWPAIVTRVLTDDGRIACTVCTMTKTTPAFAVPREHELADRRVTWSWPPRA